MQTYLITIELDETQQKQLEWVAAHHRLTPAEYVRRYVTSHIRIQADVRSEDFHREGNSQLFCEIS